MTQYGGGVRYGEQQFGIWQWEHTVNDIGLEIVSLLESISGIKKVFGFDPKTADIAGAALPAVAVTYKGFHLDEHGIQHEWLVPCFFDPSPDKAAATEQEIQEVATGVFNAFMSNPALNRTCANAFPVEGKTDYLTKGRVLLFAVLLFTVETLVVRR